MRRYLLILLPILLLILPVSAQDGLNLPSELYVLTTEGRVQRFGLGTEGVAIVTPESDFVIDFRVAPDANWLAYRTQDGLFMVNIFDEMSEPRQIEDSRAGIPLIRGRGETLAWSADSSALAYTTEYGGRVHFFQDNVFVDVTTPNLIHLQWSADGRFLAAEAEDNVWWIFQRDGTSVNLRAAIPGANGADWLSETQLLYAPIDGGLSILDLSAGNQQVQILSNASVYYNPSVTRDGQIVVFSGVEEAATLVQVELDPTSLVGTEIPIGSNGLDVSNTRWAPGGFLLTAFEGGVLALVNPLNASGFTLPVTSAASYGWGPAYPPLIINQALPRRVTFLASDLDGIQQVWTLPDDGSRARTITPATLDITEYAISPNGSLIAYVSNSILWGYGIGSDTEPVALVNLGINENVAPAWSPDNSAVYYRDEQSGESGIWRVTVEGEASLFLPDDDATYIEPNPALGAAVMLVKRDEEIAIVDTTSAEVTPLGIIGDGRWQSGTQFIVVGEAQREILAGNGIFLGDANSRDDLTLILPLLGSFELFDYRLVDGILRMLVKNQVPGDVRLLDIPITGGQAVIQGSAGNMVNPRLSPDGLIVIGQRSPEGALLLYDVSSDTTSQIDIAPPISRVSWD